MKRKAYVVLGVVAIWLGAMGGPYVLAQGCGWAIVYDQPNSSCTKSGSDWDVVLKGTRHNPASGSIKTFLFSIQCGSTLSVGTHCSSPMANWTTSCTVLTSGEKTVTAKLYNSSDIMEAQSSGSVTCAP